MLVTTLMPAALGGSWFYFLLALTAGAILFNLCSMAYYTYFHALRKIPGPWLPASSSLWIRWQRWHGNLAFATDEFLSRYGPVVRISPNMVVINDTPSLQAIFARQDLDTAPTAVRALRIGGHDWTVTFPQNDIARDRRRPVMFATTTKAMRYWHPIFEDNVHKMIRELGQSHGERSEDIVYHLRLATFQNSTVVMAGSHTRLEPDNFPHTVGEYNFLVVWRLCLPEWIFEWLKWSPFSGARFRVRSSDALYHLGEAVCQEAERADPADPDEVPTLYKLLLEKKGNHIDWSHSAISAEMAGQILAATETTSSALTFIFYELAKNQSLFKELQKELLKNPGNHSLDRLKLLCACISEGLRFRPPVAFTASRVAPAGGIDVFGHYLPAGTVLATQSLSMSRQRPDLFPNYDVFDPTRWLNDDDLSERRKHSAPFGVGARRCPGGNMALYQMRLILAEVVRAFDVTIAPETTPDSMRPFEANGFRSRYDRCRLIFSPCAVADTAEIKI